MLNRICFAVLFYFLAPAIDAACLPDSLIVTMENRIETIGCSERAGDYSRVARLIRELPPSLERDTLHLRRLVREDSLEGARLFADTAAQLRRARGTRLLWRIRIALFRGKTDECGALLDSAAILLQGAPPAELMEYRYWLLRLADNPEALAKFIQIEYTLFKGNREAAAKCICSAGLGAETAWRLAVRIARRQIDNSEAPAALATLQCAPAEKEPEYRYLLAEAQIGCGAAAQARAQLEQLLLEFPGNVYAVRGRRLLARLPKAAP